MNWIIKLDFPRECHKESYFKFVKEFFDNNENIIPKSMNLISWENYKDFLNRCENYRKWINMKPWHTKSTLLFIINVHNEVVWWIEVRHELTEELRINWWHIGYWIKPSERKKGYASKALQIMLRICENIEINKVLLCCKKENIWSAKVIKKNWWKWHSDYEINWEIEERYRINLKNFYFQ
jgi:predicted acetyltransferase